MLEADVKMLAADFFLGFMLILSGMIFVSLKGLLCIYPVQVLFSSHSFFFLWNGNFDL